MVTPDFNFECQFRVLRNFNSKFQFHGNRNQNPNSKLEARIGHSKNELLLFSYHFPSRFPVYWHHISSIISEFVQNRSRIPFVIFLQNIFGVQQLMKCGNQPLHWIANKHDFFKIFKIFNRMRIDKIRKGHKATVLTVGIFRNLKLIVIMTPTYGLCFNFNFKLIL